MTAQRADGPGGPDLEEGPGRRGEAATQWAEFLPAGIGVTRPFDPAWRFEPVARAAPEAVESRLCLAAWTVGSRAVLEEQRDPKVPPVLVAGVCESAVGIGKRLMTAPTWVTVPPAQRISAGRRVLNARDGLMTRKEGSERGTFRSVRFACHDRPRTMGHPSDGGSVGLPYPHATRTDNPTRPIQPLAPSKQSTVQALYSVFVTRPIGASRNGERSATARRRDTQCLSVSALPEWSGGGPGGGT